MNFRNRRSYELMVVPRDEKIANADNNSCFFLCSLQIKLENNYNYRSSCACVFSVVFVFVTSLVTQWIIRFLLLLSLSYGKFVNVGKCGLCLFQIEYICLIVNSTNYVICQHYNNIPYQMNLASILCRNFWFFPHRKRIIEREFEFIKVSLEITTLYKHVEREWAKLLFSKEPSGFQVSIKCNFSKTNAQVFKSIRILNALNGKNDLKN